MDTLFGSIPIDFIAVDSSSRLLTILLNSNRFDEFRNSLDKATQEALINAVEWTAKNGRLDDMKLALNHISSLNKYSIVTHLTSSVPDAIPILLNSDAYIEILTVEDILFIMTDFNINLECLRQMLRHFKYRSILFQLRAPSQIKPIAGFGFGEILVRKNKQFDLYESIIKEERHRVRESYWRALFWSVVLRTRIQEFQARYWGPDGKGYLKSKESFEANALILSKS